MINDEVKFSPNVNEVFKYARNLCNELNVEFIGTHHILAGIISNANCYANKILKRLNLDFEKVLEIVKRNNIISQRKLLYENRELSDNANNCINGAIIEAKEYDYSIVDTVHLLLGLLHTINFQSTQILEISNISYYQIRNEINKFAPKSIQKFIPPINGSYAEYFYKFYSSELVEVFEKLIENETIRFTQKEALNDKFDMHLQINKLFNLEKYINQVDYNNEEFILNSIALIPKDILNVLGEDFYRNSIRIFTPFIRDLFEKNIGKFETELTKKLLPSIESGINSNLGILSLSDDITNNPMWAHYANNYKGYAIQFNSNHEYFYKKDGLKRPISPVLYSKQTPISESLIDVFLGNSFLFLEWIFLNKSDEWAYEREWRLFNPILKSVNCDSIDKNGNKIHLFEFPREAVSGIVFGLDFDEIKKKYILNKIRNDERYKHIIPYDSLKNRETRKIEIQNLLG
jgi:hypothetical protein